ncbi:Clavaminate synthase-like protein [Xylaria sp. FL0043]|nr:Clavaminate synthase-like protein [Xylaria sp. FL0043]
MPPPTILGRSLRLLPISRSIALPRRALGCSSSRWYSQSNQQVLDLSGAAPAENRDTQVRSPLAPSLSSSQEGQFFRTAYAKYNASGDVIKHPLHSHFWATDIKDPSGPIWYQNKIGPTAAPRLVTDRTWLRDACTCSRCVDPSSGQKRFASTDVPVAPPISRAEVTADGALRVHWENDFLDHDTHISEYPSSLWAQGTELPSGVRPKPWSRDALIEASPYFAYESFMAGGPEYLRAMTKLRELGIIFLRGMPTSEEAVEDIASKIGIIQETFYGRTWDVISKPEAENVAYTSSFLGLHQDLLYIPNAPRIQILHCLKNTCDGGESLFSDGYRAAFAFVQRYQKMARLLRSRYVTYHYNKGGNIYKHSRPVLSSNRPAVWWSPPFQKPVQSDQMTEQGMHRYVQWRNALIPLKAMLEAQENVYEYKMLSGECVIFDNPRVLHGRRAFDTASGERWLKGTYVENSSYLSKLNSLNLSATDEL